MSERGAFERKLDAASDLLRALASPIRLQVIVSLAEGPQLVHELVDIVGASQSLVSQHLRVLRGAGLVETERRGQGIAYRLSDDHVAHIVRDAIAHAQEDRPG